MTARTIRRAAVSGAVALALVGVGAGTAFATTDVSDSWFAGPLYLVNANQLTDIAPGATINWATAVDSVSVPGDEDFPGFIGPDNAHEFDVFISPRGHENVLADWNAWTSGTAYPSQQMVLQEVTPSSLGTAGQALSGGPKGKDAIKDQGGEYSLGIAYRDGIGGGVIEAYYAYITVTPGTGAYTYEDLSKAVVKTPTTTTITDAPASVTSGEDFTLTATVTGAGATGTVLFKNGATTIGSATLSGGVATTTTASIGNATTAPITASVTAVYSGDTAFATSTSTPATSITVNPGSIDTHTTVTATSTSHIANRSVVLTASIPEIISADAGTVTFKGSLDGAAATVIAGPITVSSATTTTTITSLVAGDWEITAEFTGNDPYVDSVSADPAELTLAPAPVVVDQPTTDGDVTVTIPAGSVAITTPYTDQEPLALGSAFLDDADSTFYTEPVTIGADGQARGIQVIDTRAGGNGFTANIKSTDFATKDTNGDVVGTFSTEYASLTNVEAQQVLNNTLDAGNVDTFEVASLSDEDQTFASYVPEAGHETGTVWFKADYALTGIPSSVKPGDYRATLTFTVL